MKFRIVFLYFLIVFGSPDLFAQESIDISKSINDLKLGSDLDDLKGQLQLITGDESIYKNNPYLAEHVKKNLEVGIQEGIYQGHPLRVVNGSTAHDMRLMYLTGKLYKCRWTFNKKDIPNIESGFKDFLSYFTTRFGPPTENQFNDTYIWKGESINLMVNYYEDTIQIELKDNVTDKKTKQLISD